MERAIHLTRAGPAASHGVLTGPAIVLLDGGREIRFSTFTAGRYGIFRDELYYLRVPSTSTGYVASTSR